MYKLSKLMYTSCKALVFAAGVAAGYWFLLPSDFLSVGFGVHTFGCFLVH